VGTTLFGMGPGLVGLLLAGLLVTTPAWAVSKFPTTVAHEWGHVAILWVTPGAPKRVLIHANGAAETHSVTDRHGAAGVTFLIAGYPTPALLGLAGVFCAERGWVTPALVALGATLGAVLLLTRNGFGLLVMAAMILGLLAFLYYGPHDQRALVLCTVAWLLLLGGVRNAWEQYSCDGDSDAGSLHQLSAIPAGAWRAFFLAIPVASTVAAGWLLFTG
jgi:Peptidase M50B-like